MTFGFVRKTLERYRKGRTGVASFNLFGKPFGKGGGGKVGAIWG